MFRVQYYGRPVDNCIGERIIYSLLENKQVRWLVSKTYTTVRHGSVFVITSTIILLSYIVTLLSFGRSANGILIVFE